MLLESLEDRRCLAANPLAFELPALEIDPDSYDASSLIVRYTSDGSARDEGAETYGPSRIVGSKSLGGGLEKLEIAPGVALQSILGLYQKDPSVLYAEPNYRVQIAVTPDDTRFDEQWALHNEGQTNGLYDADIDATEAWEVSTGTGSTVVAVIDTGVDYLHPDLAPNMWTNVDEIPGDGKDNDKNGYVDDVHGYDF